MNSEFMARAERIFKKAITLPAGELPNFLKNECAGDSDLEAMVSRMVASDDQGMEDFLISQKPEKPTGVFSTPEVEGLWVDRFQIVRRIGQGGMGQVFLAQQQEPQREVALKILRPDLSDPSLSRRFKVEIQVLGRLNHPGIAQIHDAGTTSDGHSYFAMEYVPGKPLTDFSQRKNLDQKARLKLVAQICDAVHYAHEQGVVHRDLKPANILVVEMGDGSFQIKILDFGVARLYQELDKDASIYTLPGQLLGTLAYMSPEQAAGENQTIKPSSDVYQLGVILFEILAGKLPLKVDTETIPEALRRILEDEPPSLGTVNLAMRGDLEIIVSKAMAKEPHRRYAMAGELASDLRRYLDGLPIVARPTTAFYLLRKRILKKRQILLSLVFVAAISVLAGWVMFREGSAPRLSVPRLTMITPVVDLNSADFRPVISPDGTEVALIDNSGNMKIRNLDAKNEEVIIPAIEGQQRTYAMGWHPSGEWLLVSRMLLPDGASQLIRYDRATGLETLIFSGADLLLPVISPDGETAVLRLNNYRDLSVLDLESGKVVSLATTKDNEQFHTPVWGPNGQRIAFVLATHNMLYRLQCMDMSGDSSTLVEDRLLESSAWFSSLCWLPDGRLLYTLDRDLTGSDVDLWSLPMAEKGSESMGEPERIFASPGWMMRSLSYSETQDRLVFAHKKAQRTPAMFILGDDGTLTLGDLPTSGWPGRPKSFTPDGEYLVIRETRGNDDTDVYLQNTSTGAFSPLLCGPINDHALSLSVDGKHLFLFRGDRNLIHAELWAHSLTDSVTTSLNFTLPEEDYYQWISSPPRGPGCSYLFFQRGMELMMQEISVADGVSDIRLRLPIDPNTSPKNSILSVDMSPDATRIAYLVNEEEIFLYDLASAETLKIPVDLGSVQKLQWSADGKWIYFKGVGNEAANYWIGRVDPLTGQNEYLWGSDLIWPNEFFMSPDGRYLACQMVELGAALGMLEGL